MPRAIQMSVVVLFFALACAGRPDPQAPEATGGTEETSAVKTESARPCDYRTTELNGPEQVKVTCPGDQEFVVRRAADGTWAEEAKSRAGTRPTWTSLDQAARALCGCK
jgi:hypothetical protein